MNEQQWHYSKPQEAYLYGTEKNGCGVFTDEGIWTGNTILGDNIVCIGNHQTMKAAMDTALEILSKMREAYV